MTNADRIRAMSDEELAELAFENITCYTCPQNLVCEAESRRMCVSNLIDWLKKEAKE